MIETSIKWTMRQEAGYLKMTIQLHGFLHPKKKNKTDNFATSYEQVATKNRNFK